MKRNVGEGHVTKKQLNRGCDKRLGSACAGPVSIASKQF